MLRFLKARVTREAYFRADLAHQKAFMALELRTERKLYVSPRPHACAHAIRAISTRATLARYGLPTPALPSPDGRRRSRRTLKAAAFAVLATVRMRSVRCSADADLTLPQLAGAFLECAGRAEDQSAISLRADEGQTLAGLIFAALHLYDCPRARLTSAAHGLCICGSAGHTAFGGYKGRHRIFGPRDYASVTRSTPAIADCVFDPRLARPAAGMPSPRVRTEPGFQIDMSSADTATSPRSPMHRNRSSVSRTALACTACRRVKLRCSTQGNSVREQCRLGRCRSATSLKFAQPVCTRCTSHGLECLFEPVRCRPAIAICADARQRPDWQAMSVRWIIASR